MSPLVNDDQINDKLNNIGVEVLSDIHRRVHPGTQACDGTRYVRVRLPPSVRALPYSMKFWNGKVHEHVRVVHNDQIKVCSECLASDHVYKDCPQFTCHRCGRQGHIQRLCQAERCARCRAFECVCTPCATCSNIICVCETTVTTVAKGIADGGDGDDGGGDDGGISVVVDDGVGDAGSGDDDVVHDYGVGDDGDGDDDDVGDHGVGDDCDEHTPVTVVDGVSGCTGDGDKDGNHEERCNWCSQFYKQCNCTPDDICVYCSVELKCCQCVFCTDCGKRECNCRPIVTFDTDAWQEDREVNSEVGREHKSGDVTAVNQPDSDTTKRTPRTASESSDGSRTVRTSGTCVDKEECVSIVTPILSKVKKTNVTKDTDRFRWQKILRCRQRMETDETTVVKSRRRRSATQDNPLTVKTPKVDDCDM